MSAQKRFVLAMDIGATNLKAGLVDIVKGELVFSKSIPTEAAKGVKKVAENIERLLWDVIMEGPAVIDDILAIGYDVPGIVDRLTGIVMASCENLPGFTGFDLPSRLKSRFNLPVFALNDAKSFTMAEAIYGAGVNLSDFGLWTFGSGVGGGLFLGKMLYLGVNESAGELGHLEIDPRGPMCNQGHRGCVEAFAGTEAIKRLYRQKFGVSEEAEISVKTIFKEAEKGDAGCRQVVFEVAGYLARGVGQIVKMLDLQAAIFGGKIASEDFFLAEIEQGVRKNLFKTQRDKFLVLRAKYHDEGGIIGAAAYAWERVNGQ